MTNQEPESRQARPSLGQRVVRGLAGLAGWTIDVSVPVPDRCVVVGAPHTSSADLLATLLLTAGTGIKLRWIARDEFFRWPLGHLMRALGGMPVKRGGRTDFVGQMRRAFESASVLRLGIAPEATRRHTGHWKTGFYYIALGAGVPILFGYADYARKVVGIGGALDPTGDLQRDFAVIREFYEAIQGRHPLRHSTIALLGDSEDRE